MASQSGGTTSPTERARPQGLRPARCPKCEVAMVAYEQGGVTLDLCQRCHGLWFDRGELERLERFGLELVRLTPAVGSRRCPRCSGGLAAARLRGAGGLILDECDRCGGLFFDAGELDRARKWRAEARLLSAEADKRTLREFAERRTHERQGSITDGNIEVESAWASNGNLLSYLLGLPVEEHSSRERRPYGLLALVATIVAVWLWQVASPESVWMGLAAVPIDIIAGRRIHTLLTAAFLHGGWLHLIGNLYFLWTFGDDVEDRLGTWAFLGWYLVWALAGSAAFVVFADAADRSIPGLGASGAIAGVMGAYLVLCPRRRLIVRFAGFIVWGYVLKLPAWTYLVFWAGFQFVAAMRGLPEVGWWAHLGGFAAGVLVALRYRTPRPGRPVTG